MDGLQVIEGGGEPAPFPTAEHRTAQVLRFNGVTRRDVPVDDVLDGARHLKVVIVLGYTEDGEEHFASSVSDGADVLWLLERLKLQLLNTEA